MSADYKSLYEAARAEADALGEVIDEMLTEYRQLRRDRTAPMTKHNQAQAARHVARAVALKATGLSAPQIGIRMASDDQRPDRPYSERQVRRWLAEAKKG